MDLVIVESPVKARRIQGMLHDPSVRVMATGGHIRDLPCGSLGVYWSDGKPLLDFQVLPSRQGTLKRIHREASRASRVMVATDPDREGEAIAWHVHRVLGRAVERVSFNALTSRAVRLGLASPRALDPRRVEAALARRAVDRIVGFKLSAEATRSLGGSVAYGVGRVQAGALALIASRGQGQAGASATHAVTVTYREGLVARTAPTSGGKALTMARRLAADRAHKLSSVRRSLRHRAAPPPFTTAGMQRAANRALGWTASRTIRVAQRLYESGHLTYIRTDSTAVSEEADAMARAYIEERFGPGYFGPADHAPPSPFAQEAHECIRPTRLEREPAPGDEEGSLLLGLTQSAFIASRMPDALLDATEYAIEAPGATLVAEASRLRFDGYLKCLEAAGGEDPPALALNAPATLRVDRVQVRPLPAPGPMDEAELVGEMERLGIGRPSTYASTVESLVSHDYVTRSPRGALELTSRGERLLDWLSTAYPALSSPGFCAEIEEEIDAIAQGARERDALVRDVWLRFAMNRGEEPPSFAGCPEGFNPWAVAPTCPAMNPERFATYPRKEMSR